MRLMTILLDPWAKLVLLPNCRPKPPSLPEFLVSRFGAAVSWFCFVFGLYAATNAHFIHIKSAFATRKLTYDKSIIPISNIRIHFVGNRILCIWILWIDKIEPYAAAQTHSRNGLARTDGRAAHTYIFTQTYRIQTFQFFFCFCFWSFRVSRDSARCVCTLL